MSSSHRSRESGYTDTKLKEATAASIRLYDDEPVAMMRFIKYLYGQQYPGYGEDQLEDMAWDFETFKQTVELYVVAQKYLVPTLCEQTKTTFCAMLDWLVTYESHSEVFAQSVGKIYGKDSNETTDVREPVVAHFAEHVQDIDDNNNSDFKGALIDFPKFAVEVTGLPLEHKHEAAVGKPGPAKKRKIVTLKCSRRPS